MPNYIIGKQYRSMIIPPIQVYKTTFTRKQN